MDRKENEIRFWLDIQFFAEGKNDDNDPDDSVDEDEVNDGDGDEGGNDEGGKRKQSQSENARYAKQRREAEAKAKAEKERQDAEKRKADESYRKGLIDGIRVNPYTEETIADDYDLEIYEIQRELDEKGKDPVKELPKEIARRKREREESERKRKEQEDSEKAKEEEAKKERLAKKKAEIADVAKQYGLSNDEMADLLTDPNSEIYKKVEEKGGRWTLGEIFERYYAKPDDRKRGTPNVTPGGSPAKKSVKDMTDEEYIEYSKRVHGGF